jgi:hypothetical protein
MSRARELFALPQPSLGNGGIRLTGGDPTEGHQGFRTIGCRGSGTGQRSLQIRSTLGEVGMQEPEESEIGGEAQVPLVIVVRRERRERCAEVGLLRLQPPQPDALAGSVEVRFCPLSEAEKVRRVSASHRFRLGAHG